ncbi:MAG: protein translocase subunit SecF [Thermodesulfobacteriota bacterium]
MDIWGDTKIEFLAKRRYTFIISAILALIGLVAIISVPAGKANMGTDFSGGISLQLRFDRPVEIDKVRKILGDGGYKEANLQQFAEPTKLLVKLKGAKGDLGAITRDIGRVFAEGMADNPFRIDSTTEIGPTVGKKLQKDALWAVGISLLAILGYIAWRFEFRFGVAAVAATFHDVVVVFGILYLLDTEITLLIITALLTLAGYSLTDTVVVFDRIRENLRKRTTEGFIPLVDRSINEVLRRTIVTTFTTLLVLVALFALGGEVIHDFSLTLLLGILVGTYSSIFIASPVLLLWKSKDREEPAQARRGAPAGS